ncbi:MAG: hypothetical protein ACO1OB_28590 [Archangium sp.]
MKRALALFATVLSACGPVQQVPNCNRVSIVSGEPPATVGLVNRSTTVELTGLLDVICARNGPVATDVVVTVRDEGNQPVAETHTAPRSTGSGFATEVTFTPTSAGVYFLEARFEPAVAATQRRHVVLLDRTDEVPELISSIDAGCDTLHPLGDDIVICAKGTELSFWVDGGLDHTEPGIVDSDDGIAWVSRNALIERLERVDGGVLGRGTVAPVLTPPALGYERDRAVRVSDFNMTEFVFVDGGLTQRQQAISLTDVSFGGAAIAGDSVGWSTADQLCAGSFGRISVDCRPLETTSALNERDVLWVRTEGAQSGLAQWRVFADGSPPLLRAVPSSPALLDVSQQRPVLSWNGQFVTVRRDDLRLEAWPKLDQVATVTVTPSHVLFRRRNGEVRVYRR